MGVLAGSVWGSYGIGGELEPHGERLKTARRKPQDEEGAWAMAFPGRRGTPAAWRGVFVGLQGGFEGGAPPGEERLPIDD